MKNLEASSAKNSSSQQLLFPISLDLDQVDMDLITELSEEIEHLGFSLSTLGKQSISINGVPPGCSEDEVENLFLEMINSYKSESDHVKNKAQDNLAMALAKKLAVKTGTRMNEKEMENIVDRLFACEMPYNLPNGKVIVVTIPLDELNKRFNY